MQGDSAKDNALSRILIINMTQTWRDPFAPRSWAFRVAEVHAAKTGDSCQTAVAVSRKGPAADRDNGETGGLGIGRWARIPIFRRADEPLGPIKTGDRVRYNRAGASWYSELEFGLKELRPGVA
jgi:hypothetical protein